MGTGQEKVVPVGEIELKTERLGPLPIINHFIKRLGLPELLTRFVPTHDRRVRLPYDKGLGVLLRSILVEREPIYRQHETVSTFAPATFDLENGLIRHVKDDAVGRSLDRFFDADRGALLTELVVSMASRFEISFKEIHNDSTSIRFCGQYRAAKGRSIRGKLAPFITYGYSKDHRPDLKQLLFIITTSADGGVPVQFRCEAGNCNDSRTHEETWDTLREISGNTRFLYVADSKLCNREALDHINNKGGRLVCVIPRSRHEDGEFRHWIQTNEPDWQLVWDRPHPRRRHGPRDRWWVHRHYLPSVEGWPVIWVLSSTLRRRQERRRREHIDAATEELAKYNDKMAGPRPRRRSQRDIFDDVEEILKKHRVNRYITVNLVEEEKHSYRQSTPGRPTSKTRYIRKTRKYFRLEWALDAGAIEYDQKSDGMYPLLTNDRDLSAAEVLEAHKRQPSIEKRFEQTKTVFDIAPVLLKNEGRVEALFYLYFLSLVVQSLIEREIRLAMSRENIDSLPLYPEERKNKRPTCEQIFRLFSLAERNILTHNGKEVRRFDPVLTPIQRQVLALLGIDEKVYRSSASPK
jgi:transposase